MVVGVIGLRLGHGRHMPRLEVDHVDVIEHMLPVRAFVHLALGERVSAFPTVNQAHPLIIAPRAPYRRPNNQKSWPTSDPAGRTRFGRLRAS
jgi:hypothetical protein